MPELDHIGSLIPDRVAICWKDLQISYAELSRLITQKKDWLNEKELDHLQVVGLKGDFSPHTISLLLALFSKGLTVALLPFGHQDSESLCRQVGVQVLFEATDDGFNINPIEHIGPLHPLLQELKEQQEAGFIIFSSGSSGTPKPILHSLNRFLKKYDHPGKAFKTLSFLLLDHIAGMDTLFYILFTGGTLVAPTARSPKYICALIEQFKVEVLPVSPSFLNLLWISGDYEHHDLSSVKIVTFGSEPMTEHNLEHVKVMFPSATIKQKYGTSEFGSPASKSRKDNQLWIQLDGEQFKTKIIDGILYVKSETTMLGYLDDSEPMFVDGWYNTGDRVEQDGDWIRIIGRDSDIINVGGQKVYPAKVEAVNQNVEGVIECSVFGEDNPITGNMVCAVIRAETGLETKTLKKRIRKTCQSSLQRYMVPVKYTFTDDELTNIRQKKIRSSKQIL